MKIVVLDGYTLNPGDLSWSGLEKLGDLTVYDRTPSDKVFERARGAEIILTNKVPVTGGTMDRLPGLEYIGVLATGYNIVDAQAARERGVIVTSVPAYGTRSVAQMTFALLLELAHRTGHHAETVGEGRWSGSDDFCYRDYPLTELDGLTIGLVGLGRIGKAAAGIASAFGMKVIAHDPFVSEPGDIKLTGMDFLLKTSDVISLHCQLTGSNTNLINSGTLAMMKPSAFLINTARGQLVDEKALADALNAGRLAGAGLDVLAKEPPEPGNPLLKAKNCIITPHISWATGAARKRLMETAVSNVRAFLSGKPDNVVNR